MGRKSGSKALVLWTRDKMVGIEPINHVPQSSRFDGAATVVRFSGDKKFYPAKVLMISDNETALEEEANRVGGQLEREKEKQPLKRMHKKKLPDPSVASERAVSQAVGQRAPVPPAFASAQKAAQKARKEASVNHATGQALLDNQVLRSLENCPRRSLFISDVANSNHQVFLRPDSDSDGEGAVSLDEELSSSSDEDGSTSTADSVCVCQVCKTLRNYCDPKSISLLQALQTILENGVQAQGQKYLSLLPIPEGIKKVELHGSSNSNIFICASDKDMLKLDYKNKPSSLVRETLFVLYGKDALKTHIVTGRGTKPGSFGVADAVLQALYGFVNHNVDVSKRLKLHQIVHIINKRAPEWRKNLLTSGKTSGKTPGKTPKRKFVRAESSPSPCEMDVTDVPRADCEDPPAGSEAALAGSEAALAGSEAAPAGSEAASAGSQLPHSTSYHGCNDWKFLTGESSMQNPGLEGSWSGPWPQQYNTSYQQYQQHYPYEWPSRPSATYVQ
ncbi:Suppressor of smlA [Frankliniella fusca]|uniref:Suppressor of smlA n=1 Tax=Frankliniella fusca TaxID=407009 RepID=A0AAE1IV96_9NEOP|nr:Suppressor of smlA [Frankliniella fusca]